MPDWGRTTLELIVQELQRPVRVDESFDPPALSRYTTLTEGSGRKEAKS